MDHTKLNKIVIIGLILIGFIILIFVFINAIFGVRSYNYGNNALPTIQSSITPSKIINIDSYKFPESINTNLNQFLQISTNISQVNSPIVNVYNVEDVTGDEIAKNLSLQKAYNVDGRVYWQNSNYILSYLNNAFTLKNLVKNPNSGQILATKSSIVQSAENQMQQVFGMSNKTYTLNLQFSENEYTVSVSPVISGYPIFTISYDPPITVTFYGNGVLDNIKAYDFPIKNSLLGEESVLSAQASLSNFASNNNFVGIADNVVVNSDIYLTFSKLTLSGSSFGYLYIKGNKQLIPGYVLNISGVSGALANNSNINMKIFYPAVDPSSLNLIIPTQVPTVTPTANPLLDYGSKK